jgi:hypothetical protein
MGALLVALIPLISDAAAGEGIAAALGSLTVTQWVTIAAQSLTAEPQIVAAVKALHPAIGTFLTAVENGADHTTAASALFAHLHAGEPLMIPGYGPHGELIEIPNPDNK